MKTSWIVAVIFVLATATCRAMTGGSAYSRYGIGHLRYFSSSRATGMGGVSLAISGGSEVNRSNPAAWTQLKRTAFSGTFAYEGLWTSDGPSSAFYSAGEFGGAMVAVPIMPSRGIVLAGGFNPYSSVNYDIVTTGFEAGTAYDIRYSGNGGLSNALLGFSYAPASDFHLGFQTQFLFGTVENTQNVSFLSTGFFSSETRRTNQYHGFQFTVGIMHSGVGSWIGLSNKHRLSVGAVITTPVSLDVERETLTTFISRADSLTLEEGNAFVPPRFGLGAALTIDGRYLIGTDVLFQQWDRFEEFGVQPTELRNSFRWSIGVERLPAAEPMSFGERVAYRLGFAYNGTYYRVKGESLDEALFSAGIEFPIGPTTRANFAIEYGFRGTTTNQLQRDNLLRFTFTVNVGELWFVRPPEE